MNDQSLGYPLRSMIALAAAFALILLLEVMQLTPPLQWQLAALVTLVAVVCIARRTYCIRRARQHCADVLQALGAHTADLPYRLRARLPLVLVLGDALDKLFPPDTNGQLLHVSDDAIWVCVTRPQALPQLALALQHWRAGRAPDAIMLVLAPALHEDQNNLAHCLCLLRQARSDTARLLGISLPGYLAVYQRMSDQSADHTATTWHGISSARAIERTHDLNQVIVAAEAQAQVALGQLAPAWCAATLPTLIQWTRQCVLSVLQDRTLAAAPWPLHGIGWIDCGPADAGNSVWQHHLRAHTHLTLGSFNASEGRWPLPRNLLTALPQRARMSPRQRAYVHFLILVAIAAALGGSISACNNRNLIMRSSDALVRFSALPVDQDAQRRQALAALVVERDQLERYQHGALPLSLSFGMYRGTALLPALNQAIASYQPPAPAPTIVTLDSMSLFASGQATLQPGSTRTLVAALEMIKAHPHKRILVAGHTDNSGDATSNQRLSLARARAVRDWLSMASELAPSRFAIQGYGDTRPLADNHTDAGRAHNRRVDITLVPDFPATEAALTIEVFTK